MFSKRKAPLFSDENHSFGNVTQTKVGSTALVTNIYGSNNGLLQKSEYANGDAIRYQYNKSGLVTGIYQDNDTESLYRTFAWDYSSNGTPRVHKDGVTALKYDYSYDSIGRLIRTDISNSTSNAYVGSTEYGYDVRNNLTSISNDIGGINYLQEYAYYDIGTDNSEAAAKDNLPTKYKALSKETVYTYNTLNQLIDVNFNTTTDVNKHYVYNNYTDANGNKFYTNQLNCETLNGTSYHYSYDNVGNITEIKKGTGYGTTTSDYRTYEYDVLDRLVVEKNNTNKQVVTYTYNHLGNITQKQIDTYTNTTLTGTPTTKVITYNYGNDGKTGWNYLLTSYDADSDGVVDTNERILYDGIGNPLTYRGATLAWYGRQLRSFTKNGITSTMTYDADGLRSSKTVAGVKTEYQYVGDKLFYEKRGDGNSFYYFYDSYGKLSAIYHHKNGDKTAYHVVTNAQGDVIALYSWTGTKVAEYSYDAWGNCTIVSDTSGTDIATLNPMRYRSYYYDSNLGLYYLQSRYYDSEIGRFINADGVIDGIGGDVRGYNMYAYCMNNPVNMTDGSGHWPKWLSGVVNVVSGVTQMVAGATLGATVGWTGIGAVAAGLLIANGAATATQGVGQIINDVTNSSVLREDNIVRSSVQSSGEFIAGDIGSDIAGLLYDSSTILANAYAGKIEIKNHMPQIVNSKLFEINGGYGISIGQTSKSNYGNVNLLYQNPSFLKDYGIRGGTFVSILNDTGECLFRIDWDPKDGLHTQGRWTK